MSAIFFIFFLLIQVVAGLITGVTSFGGGLFAIPLMTLFLPIQHAIVIGCISFGIVIFLMLKVYWKYLLWREIFTLGIAGVIGAPFGTWLLAHANMRFLLLASGVAIGLFLFWQWVMPRIGRKETLIPGWYAWPCGFLGGFMTGTVGMGGPPIVFYAYMRHWRKESMIGSVAAACGIQLIMIISGQVYEGLCTWEVVKLSIWAAAGNGIGLLLSLPIVKIINVKVFRYLVLFMLTISAITLTIKGLLLS